MGSGGEIPIPIPISSAYVVGGGGHGLHDPPPVLHPSSNGPPPPLSAAEGYHHAAANNNNSGGGSGVYSSKKGGGVAAKYRECLKNHAAAIGGSATDGCGEFMPSGEEGTLEALKCSACGCHRNFHRKETDGRKAMTAAAAAAFACGTYNHPAAPHGMIMPLGAMRSSESDELEGGVLMGRGGHGVHAHPPPAAAMAKKRFRTKFTAEQKEKMLSFAERLGWRLQRQEEGVVQRFCQEIGVKRRVLKVWMHNNKHHHSMAKKSLNAAAE